jgi:hypothetical protein
MSGFLGRPGATDIEAGEAWDLPEPDFLAGARSFFDSARPAFEALGLTTAAENLRRYRGGQGGTRSYSDEEIGAHPAFLAAEERNRTRFESRTFTGRTGNPVVNDSLHGLRDGQSYVFPDDWDVDIGLSRPSTYLAFGRAGVQSRGDFLATRNGDRLSISGTVHHLFDPKDSRFDFNAGQIGQRQAGQLERAGAASPFDMVYDREQDVEAELRYEPGGSLTLMRTRWGPIR